MKKLSLRVLFPAIFLAFLILPGCGTSQAVKITKTKDKISGKQLKGTTIALQVTAPADAPAGREVKLVEFAMATNQLDIFWKKLVINQTGNIGDDDIPAVKIYLDDGNDVFEPSKDIPIGSGQVKNAVAEIEIPQHPIGSAPQLYYLVAAIAPNTAEGLTIGVRLDDKSFDISDILGISFLAELPFSSGTTIITKPIIGAEPEAATTAKPPVATTVTSGGDTGQLDKYLQEQERLKTIRMQENEFIAQKHYETAYELFKQFNYNQALEYLERALKLNPYHREAEKLRNEIQLILGSRSEEIKTIKDFMESQLAIKIQETEIEVRNHFLKGERFFGDRDYKEAMAEFEKASEKVQWIPYEIPLLKEYQERADERIRSCRDRIAKQDEELARQQRNAAARLAEEEEQRRRREFSEKIRLLFNEAILSYERKQYEQTELLCQKIIKIVPYFRAAEELRKESIRARHYKVSTDYLARRTEQLKAVADDQAETIIPYADDKMVRYDPEAWEVASHRKPAGIVESKNVEDPDIIEIQRKLKAIKHPFILDGNATLYEVTDYLQQQYKIPIQYDPQVRNDGTPDEKKSLTLTGLPLEAGLRNLLEIYGLTFMLKQKSLWIVKTSTPTEELEWRAYDVSDLVRPIPEFQGPGLEFEQSAGAGGFTLPAIETQPAKSIPIEELIEMVKKNTGKNIRGQSSWEGDAAIPGASLTRMGDSNRLMVVHTPTTHEEVMEFLGTLRYFRSGMIAIETVFLATTNDFIESVGIELRDLSPAAASNIPEAGLPGGVPPAPYGSGVFISNPAQRDIRFRTAYSFRNAAGFSEYSTGGRLSARGGLGLQWTIFDRPQINLLLQMMEKTGKGQVLDAPKIIALNGQRVNVSYIRQRNYIKDVEVLGGMQGYDPTIATFTTGIVLDVKPVVSYDRKFVTIHAFPSLMQLQQLRNFDLRPTIPTGALGPLFEGATDTFVQLPWLSLQRCRTSAVVPDKGALLLGGIKRMTDRSLTGSTPFFEKIPILGALFRRKIKSDEKELLLIIIKAEIIELAELEKELE